MNRIIDFEIKAVSDRLKELRPHTPGDALASGSMDFFTFLATRTVMPIVCSFFGSVLYNKYREAILNTHVDQAKAELTSATQSENPVDRQQVLSDVTRSLIKERLTEEEAKSIFEETYWRIDTRLKKARHERHIRLLAALRDDDLAAYKDIENCSGNAWARDYYLLKDLGYVADVYVQNLADPVCVITQEGRDFLRSINI